MKVQSVVVGAFAVNCYIISNDRGRAFVVDPGGDAHQIAAIIRHQSLSVSAYLITHGHTDHVSALAELESSFPAPIGIHARDARWAFQQSNALPPYYGPPGKPSGTLQLITDGQTWDHLGSRCRVLETPGHSPGCVCFHFPDDNMVFTGDTLFAGSVGRTDLPGSDEDALAKSLQCLTTLPDETMVFPGHGPQSTIGREKRSNPFLRP